MVPVQLLFLPCGWEDLGSTRYFVRVLVSGGKVYVKAKIKQKLMFLMVKKVPVIHPLWKGTPWITWVRGEGAGVPSPAPLTIPPVTLWITALWACKLTHLSEQRQNVPVQQILTPRRYWQSGALLSQKCLKAQYYWAFCVREKFRHLWSFSKWVRKCCTMNTSKPKKSGEGRERMLIFSSAYR